MNQEFISALGELAHQKNMKKEDLLETIELALIAAYKKNYGHAQNVADVYKRQVCTRLGYARPSDRAAGDQKAGDQPTRGRPGEVSRGLP